MEDTLIIDFINLHQEIIRIMNSKNKVSKFIYKNIIYRYYHHRMIKILNSFIHNKNILNRNNINELMTCLYNSFPGSNGAFDQIKSCKHYIFDQNTSKENYMNECVVNLDESGSTALIRTYTNSSDSFDNKNIKIDFHIINSDQKSFVSSFSFIGEMLIADTSITKEQVSKLNLILLNVIKNYIEWCFNNDGE